MKRFLRRLLCAVVAVFMLVVARPHAREGFRYAEPFSVEGLGVGSKPQNYASPKGYSEAERTFNSELPITQRIFFQVLMTAAGGWNAVPTDRFTHRLFFAIKQFQTENGFTPTGIPNEPFIERLFLLATPMLDLWGFQWVNHPSRGYGLWVPLGLGLTQDRNEYGLVFDDPKKRIHIDFTTVPNVSIRCKIMMLF